MASWSRCRVPARAGPGVDLRGLAGGVAPAWPDGRAVSALGLELGHRHCGAGSRVPPGQSGFFLMAWVSAVDRPSWAAGRCRPVRDGSPGRSTPATLVAWCAGSCWCTAPHPLCAIPGVCPWLVLVSADRCRSGHLPGCRGPWLKAGLRPAELALRCCAALCGIDADNYDVAATYPFSNATVAKCRQRGGLPRGGAREVRDAGADHPAPGQ